MASFNDLLARTRQGLLLGVAFVVLIVITATTAWLVRQSATDAALVAHTLRVQDMMSDVLLNARRAESGQRGYLFTNQQRYLDDFNGVRPQIDKNLDRLRELVRDNPARVHDVEEMASLIKAKFVEMNTTVDLNRNGQREEARGLVLGGTGRDLMNDLRTLVERANADEGRLLGERTDRSQTNNQLLLFVSLFGTILIILIGALSVYLVQRNSRQRELAQSELASNNANLERIVQFRTADLQEANDEIQRFAYIVSHDLRSPLVNIMGFTSEIEALRKDLFERVAQLQQDIAKLQPSAGAAEQTTTESLGKEFDEALGFIKTSIAKMDRLINAVLRLSREGRRQFNPERIDMSEMMQSIAQSVAHRAAEQGAKIDIAGLPAIESDRLAIEQIFSNLIDNAVKYGSPGQPGRISVMGHEAGAQVIYDVRDNGRGIDPQDHQRVFELFRRSGTQDLPGEGIGLAHVRALVRRIGGNISLQSELGNGSKFTVTLPRRWTLEKKERCMNSQMSELPVEILMIEDDEGHARLIEKNIRRAGVNNKITPFANGTDAIKFLFGADGSATVNKGRPLLVLLDLNLPDMTGVDILKRIKTNEHIKRIPVVVLTTTDDAAEIQRCYDLGCNVYITKPVNYDNFAHAIRQLGLFFSVIQVPASD